MSTIRDAVRADIPLLASLATETFIETFGHLYKPEDLQTHLADKCSETYFEASFAANDTTYLVELEGVAIGYGKLGHVEVPVKPKPAPGGLEFHRVYIQKAHQGRGHGRNLLMTMLTHPRVQLAPVLYLGVWQENLKAQALYKQYGFTIVGEYLYAVGQQMDHEFIMARVR